jgi:osmoprotectant transport system permease protein
MTWFLDHIPEVLPLAWTHAYLAGIPLVVGLLLAMPLGWLARR